MLKFSFTNFINKRNIKLIMLFYIQILAVFTPHTHADARDIIHAYQVSKKKSLLVSDFS